MIDWETISMKDLAGYIAEELRSHGVDTVLVGGACVTIYSNNIYQSYDLDFISYEEMKKIKSVLQTLGFIQKQKYFQHPACRWFIEFVSPPIAIGNEPIHEFNKIRTRLGEIKLLKAVDSVKDRLASYYYWGDKQGLDQAINICMEQHINIKEVERWSQQENQIDKFNEFKRSLKNRLKK
jgi:hypothetical protein